MLSHDAGRTAERTGTLDSPASTSPGKRPATPSSGTASPAAHARIDHARALLSIVREQHLPQLRAAGSSSPAGGTTALRRDLSEIDRDLRDARRATRDAEDLAEIDELTQARESLRFELSPFLSATTADASPDSPASSEPILIAHEVAAAAVQRYASGTPVDETGISSIAARGVAGGGGRLPHLDTIQRAFGPHDITGVEAHVGGAAATAAGAIGADAYATGNQVAFASSPSLFVAAHEAAHVVQQRAGVHLLGGIGQAGDTYEQHADAVADRVVRGESAAPLLQAFGVPAGVSGSATVQRKEATTALDLRLVLRHLAEEVTAASAMTVASGGTQFAVSVDGVVGALALVAEALQAAGAIDEDSKTLLDEVVDRVATYAKSATDANRAKVLDAKKRLVHVAKEKGINIRAHGERTEISLLDKGDHKKLFAECLDRIEERAEQAVHDLENGQEMALLIAHAHGVQTLLEQARAQVQLAATSGATSAFASAVSEIDPAIDQFFAWGRTKKHEMEVVGLEELFDAYDALRQEVGLEPRKRAEAYYSDQTATTNGKDRTSEKLIKDILLVYEMNDERRDHAVQQVGHLLHEPPPPAEPDRFEELFKGVIQTLVGSLPGRVGSFATEVVGLALGGSEGAGSSDADLKGVLLRVVSHVAEFGSEEVGVGDIDKESEVEPHVTDEIGADERFKDASEGEIKSRFLNQCYVLLDRSIESSKQALIDEEDNLRRMPPGELQKVLKTLRQVGPDELWNAMKSDILVQWLNLQAGLRHGLDKTNAASIDRNYKRRKGETYVTAMERHAYRDACLNIDLEVTGSGRSPTVTVASGSVHGIDANLIRELREDARQLLALPVHRFYRIHIAWHGESGGGNGTVYLNTAHEMELDEMDGNFMELLGRIAAGADSVDPKSSTDHAGIVGDAEENRYRLSPAEAKQVALRLIAQTPATTAILGEE